MTTIDAAALLKGVPMRVTRPRTAVLTMVAEHPHSDADTIVSTVRRDVGSVSTQGVYDVLHALTAAGLLRRIEPAGSPARFETRVGDNHHHLVCRRCGAITDVNCVVGEAPCLDVAAPSGYAVEQAEVTFWGTCPGCLANE